MRNAAAFKGLMDLVDLHQGCFARGAVGRKNGFSGVIFSNGIAAGGNAVKDNFFGFSV